MKVVTHPARGAERLFPKAVDHTFYLRMLRRYAREEALAIWGFCLLPSEVVLLAEPGRPKSISRTMGRASQSYARGLGAQPADVWAAAVSRSVEAASAWPALRDIELAPVLAGLVQAARDWPWSSAREHLGLGAPGGLIETTAWRAQFTPAQWRMVLEEGTPRRGVRHEAPVQTTLWKEAV